MTELAPPSEVSLMQKNGAYLLVWRPSQHEDEKHFSGYNIYVAPKSLIFTSPDDLPQPLQLGIIHRHLLTDLPQESKLFIHVRSRNVKGAVSLPSLPELTSAGE